MRIKTFLKIFLAALKESIRDRFDGLAAAVAYFQLLSFPPLVALLILFANKIFGEERAKADIYPVIADFFHPKFVDAIKYMIEYSLKQDDTQLATISFLAVLSLLFGTLNFFEQVKDCIETFWDVRREEVGIKAKLGKKAEALIMAFTIFVILMTGFLLRYVIFHPSLDLYFFSGEVFIETVVIFTIIVFFLIYCPPVKLSLREVFPGAVVTTILYMAGRMVLAKVLNNKQSEAEDSTAVLLMYLVWAYYSALIFLYGAEFSRIYIERKRELAKKG